MSSGELIARVLDVDGPMEINLKVPEGWIHDVLQKMKARVSVDAFPDVTLDGVVTEVARQPDPPNPFSPDAKVYTTRIRLNSKLAGLRPGMTASAVLVIDRREDAIAVPVGAIIHLDGKDRVAVKQPDGAFEWREVVLGRTDGEKVEVKEGLRDGEQVILGPAPFLTDEERARSKTPTPPAAPKKPAAARKDRGKP